MDKTRKATTYSEVEIGAMDDYATKQAEERIAKMVNDLTPEDSEEDPAAPKRTRKPK